MKQLDDLTLHSARELFEFDYCGVLAPALQMASVRALNTYRQHPIILPYLPRTPQSSKIQSDQLPYGIAAKQHLTIYETTYCRIM